MINIYIHSTTIRKMISELNNNGKLGQGGYWLPYFQRSFVWNEEQIYSLFDSVVRNYPIGSFLVWKTDYRIKYRNFTINYISNNEEFDFCSDIINKAKYLVLDGQQRLQSFYLGLIGKYNNRILCFDVLNSGISDNASEIKYKFKFLEKNEIKPPYISVAELIMNDESARIIRKRCIDNFEKKYRNLSSESLDKIEENIELISRRFTQDEAIYIQEIDSLDNKLQYSLDDIVEIFIKCNSGGTILGKSDLLFSLLSVSWEDSYEFLDELVHNLNNQGYDFTRDFILKTCLSIFKKGTAYSVDKFRDLDLKKNIEKNWIRISDAISDVRDYIYSNTYIRCDKALTSYLALIPLIYFRYNFPDKWKHAKDKDIYILKVLLCRAFSGSPDNLIDNITRRIDLDSNFIVKNIFEEIQKKNRTLEISFDDILKESYTSKNIHLVFNLLYKNFDYTPLFINNTPELDHIFPVSLLKKIKTLNPRTGRIDMLRYKTFERNQIANLMLLTKGENSVTEKSNIPPEIWFESKDKNYLYKNMIPENPELWKLENFESFIEERKKIIVERLKNLLY